MAAGAAAAAGFWGGECFTDLKLAGGRADGCVRLFAPARFGGLSLFTYSAAGPGPAEAGAVDLKLAAAGPGDRGAAAGAQAHDVGAVLKPRNAAGSGGSSVDSGVWFAAASGGAVEAAATAAVELGDGSFDTTAGCSVGDGQG